MYLFFKILDDRRSIVKMKWFVCVKFGSIKLVCIECIGEVLKIYLGRNLLGFDVFVTISIMLWNDSPIQTTRVNVWTVFYFEQITSSLQTINDFMENCIRQIYQMIFYFQTLLGTFQESFQLFSDNCRFQ